MLGFFAGLIILLIFSPSISPALLWSGDERLRARQVDATVAACAQVWGGEDTSKTPLLKKCLRAVFHALAVNQLSLVEALELTTATDPHGIRSTLTALLDDEIYETVWDDLNALRPREFSEQFASTNNRLIEFLSAPGIRSMLGAVEHAIDLRTCMDEGHIVLVNLQPRQVSEDNARLIGTLILNTLMVFARQRDKRTAMRHPFYLYVDECYKFLGSDIESMLDESRKMGLHLVLSHQRLSQLTKDGDQIFNAVMTNAQTKIVFGGLSEADSEIMATELLRPEFDFNRPKSLLDKPAVVGHRVEYHETMSVTESSSDIISEGHTDFSTATSGTSETVLSDGTTAPVIVTHAGLGGGVGSSHGRARVESVAVTRGQVPMLRPELAWLPTAVESPEEILHHAKLRVRELPERAFILKRPDEPSQQITTPEVKNPTSMPRRVGHFTETAYRRSPYALPESDAVALIGERRRRLLLQDRATITSDSINPEDWKDTTRWEP